MKKKNQFDVIIIGGSYSGLAAAMALGRALKNVLVIDSGKPCNAQTPHSHNFLTQDGNTPSAIALQARTQIEKYETVQFHQGLATKGTKTANGFVLTLENGQTFDATKLIFATGVKDKMPDMQGFSECWGISVIHCPYCHGYEVRNTKTGILGDGEHLFEYAKLISNWTNDLSLFTNGKTTLTAAQIDQLEKHQIKTIPTEIAKIEQANGQINNLVFKDGTKHNLNALYAPQPFEQHCSIPQTLGCELTEDGYLKTNAFQETSIPGIFACGDSTTRMRTVANAVAMGTTAGIMASKELISEQF